MATRTFTPQGHVHFFVLEPFGFTGGTGRSGLGEPTGAAESFTSGKDTEGKATPCRRQ